MEDIGTSSSSQSADQTSAKAGDAWWHLFGSAAPAEADEISDLDTEDEEWEERERELMRKEFEESMQQSVSIRQGCSVNPQAYTNAHSCIQTQSALGARYIALCWQVLWPKARILG